MSNSLTATSFILQALQPTQTAAHWLAAVDKAPVDWNDICVRAIVFGLAPQLYHRLTTWNVALPPRAAAKLAVTHQAQAKRNQSIYTQLDEILEACHAHGIQPIALKGVHLAALWYAEPALRPMNDIDLLFRPEEMDTVDQILTDLGYHSKYKSAEMGAGVTKHTSTYKRQGDESTTPNPYLSTTADRVVEPHTSLEESWFGLKVDITPGLRERTHTAVLGQQPGAVLANEDLLLHLCLHFCFHLIQGAPSMVQFTDLLTVTQAAADGRHSFDWAAFTKRTIAHRAAPYSWAALTLAYNILAAPVPEDALQTLKNATPSLLRRRISQLTLADILKRTQQKPLTSISQRIWRGVQDRAETARWAPDWHGRWQVWRTAFNIGRTDTGQILLGHRE